MFGDAPCENVDNKGGDNEGVHSHEGKDREVHRQWFVEPREEGNQHLDTRRQRRQPPRRRLQRIVARLVTLEKCGAERMRPRHVRHELRRHEVA